MLRIFHILISLLAYKCLANQLILHIFEENTLNTRSQMLKMRNLLCFYPKKKLCNEFIVCRLSVLNKPSLLTFILILPFAGYGPMEYITAKTVWINYLHGDRNMHG